MPRKGHFIGHVDAPNEAAALKAAIKEFDVTEEEQTRLVARREERRA